MAATAPGFRPETEFRHLVVHLYVSRLILCFWLETPLLWSVIFCEVGSNFLKTLGYSATRQKGSHIRLHHKERISVTVPRHKPVSRGVLRKILRDTNETAESLQEFLER